MALFGDKSMPRGTTPDPSPKIREATSRIVTALGGRVHREAVHSDRSILFRDDDATEGARKRDLMECGHVGVLVDLPESGRPASRSRLCIVCDAVPRMPRITQKAKEVLG